MRRITNFFRSLICTLLSFGLAFTPITANAWQPASSRSLLTTPNLSTLSFELSLDVPLNRIKHAVLEYSSDQYASGSLVKRRINRGPFFGGHVSTKKQNSNRLAEPISPIALQNNRNTIEFAENAFGILPTISDLSLTVFIANDDGKLASRKILARPIGSINGVAPISFQQPLEKIAGNSSSELPKLSAIAVSSDQRILVSGSFNTTAKIGHVEVAGRLIAHFNGRFETIIDTKESANHSQVGRGINVVSPETGDQIRVPIQTDSGLIISKPVERYVSLTNSLPSAREFGVGFSKDEVSDSSPLNFIVRCNRYLETPAPRRGLINNFAGQCSSIDIIRRDIDLTNGLKIELPAHLEHLPKEFKPENTKPFVYDVAQNAWAVQSDGVLDLENKTTILTLGKRSARVMTGVLKVDESAVSRPAKLSVNRLGELAKVDPTAGEILLNPPAVDSMGNAKLSFPLRIRPLRGEFGQPLGINYDSNNVDGNLGRGWSVSVPIITVDTRWGVPEYHPNHESDSYLFNGQELLPVDQSGKLQIPPHRKSQDLHDRCNVTGTDCIKHFRLRRDNSYALFKRYGRNPTDYWWEIEYTNGVREYFGLDPLCEKTVSEHATRSVKLTGTIIGRSQWAKARAVDGDGNTISWRWGKVDAEEEFLTCPKNVTSFGEDRALYLNSVLYNDTIAATDAKTKEPYEKNRRIGRTLINLKWRPFSPSERHLYTSTGNHGSVYISDRLLERLSVAYQHAPKRAVEASSTSIKPFSAYEFENNLKKVFGRPLLSKITQWSFEPEHEVNLLASSVSFKDNDPKSIKKSVEFDYFEGPQSTGAEFKAADQPIILPIEPKKPKPLSLLASLSGFNQLDAGSPLGTSKNSSFGGSIYIGVAPYADKRFSGGFKGAYSSRKSENLSSFFDADGDGIADYLVKSDQGVKYCPATRASDGKITYSSVCHSPGLIRFSNRKETSTSIGGEFHFPYSAIGAGVSDARSIVSAYHADVDGDRIPDLVDGGGIRFGHINDDGKLSYRPKSKNYPGNKDIPTTTSASKSLKKFAKEQLSQATTKLQKEPVRVPIYSWRAPYSGDISFPKFSFSVESYSSDNSDKNIADTTKLEVLKNLDTCGQIEQSPFDGTLTVEAGCQANAVLPPVDSIQAICKAEPDTPICELFEKRITVERGDILYFKVTNSAFDGATSLVSSRFPRSSFDIDISYLTHAETELNQNLSNASWNMREKYVVNKKDDVNFSIWLKQCWSLNQIGTKPDDLSFCGLDRKSPYFFTLSDDLNFGSTGAADPIVDVHTKATRTGSNFTITSDFKLLGKFSAKDSGLDDAKVRLVAQVLSDDKQSKPLKCECKADKSQKAICLKQLKDDVDNASIPGVDKSWNWSTFSFDNGIDPQKERRDYRVSQRALIEPIHRMTDQKEWHLIWEGSASNGELDIDNGASGASQAWNEKLAEICHQAWDISGGKYDCSNQRLRGRFRLEVFDEADGAKWSAISWPQAPRLETPVKPAPMAAGYCSKHLANNLASKKAQQSTYLTPILRDDRNRTFVFSTQTKSGRDKLDAELTRISGVNDAGGNALPLPIESGQGYLLPKIQADQCDTLTGLCTYRFSHGFATHRPAWSVEEKGEKAFEIELRLLLDGKPADLLNIARFKPQSTDFETGKDKPGGSGKPFENMEQFFKNCVSRTISGADPDGNCKLNNLSSATTYDPIKFFIDDDNFTSGRDRIYEFHAKPGQRLHINATVTPLWNSGDSGTELDLVGYRSKRVDRVAPIETCSKVVQNAKTPVMSRDISTLLEPRPSRDECRPWYSLSRAEIRLGVPGVNLTEEYVRIFPNLNFKEAYAPKLGASNSGDNDPRLPAIFANNRGWSMFTLAGSISRSFKEIQWENENPASNVSSSDIGKMKGNALDSASAADGGSNNPPPIFSTNFADDSKTRAMRAIFAPNFASTPEVENSSVLTKEPNHTCGVDAESATDVTAIKLRRCYIGSDSDQWVTFEGTNEKAVKIGQAAGRNKFDTLEEVLPGFQNYASGTAGNDGGNLCGNGAGQCESERPFIGTAPPLVTKSDSTSWNAALVVSATSTRTKHRDSTGYSDLNGDGYPDTLVDGKAHLSNPTGRPLETWYPAKTPRVQLNREASESLGFGISFPQAVTTVLSMISSRNSQGRQQANPSFGLGVPFDVTKGETKSDQRLMDINGDGIADQISLGSQFNVAIGLGQHDNTNVQTWNENTSQPVVGNRGGGLAINLGYDDGNGGFAGGVTIGRNVAIGKGDTLVDMNADSRLDLVKPSDQGFIVRFNTGHGFSSPMLLKTPDALKLKLTTASETTQLTAGMSFYTAGPPLCIVSCWLIINPGINTANSLSRTLVSLQDFDGDGFTDIATADGVFKGEDNPISEPGSNAGKQVTQYFSNLGKAGRLRTVTSSAGSTIGLDYKIVGSEGKYTFEKVGYLQDENDAGLIQPYEKTVFDSAKSVWAVSRVTVDRQAEFDDGGHEFLLSQIEYKHGNYSRSERSFLGFANVVQRDYGCNDRSKPNECIKETNRLRWTEKDFVNTSVYLSGSLRRDVVKPLSGTGKLSSKRYVYGLYDHGQDGKLLEDKSRHYNRWRPLRLSPQLKGLEVRTFESGDTYVSSLLQYEYDEHGNVVSMLDQLDNENDPFLVKLDYFEPTTKETKLSPVTQHLEQFVPRHLTTLEIADYGFLFDRFQPKNRARRVSVWLGKSSEEGTPKRVTDAIYHEKGARQKTLCQYQNAEQALYETGRLSACRIASDVSKWAGTGDAPLHDLTRNITDEAGLDLLPIITQLPIYDDFGNSLETLTPFNGSGDWIERQYDYSADPLRQTATKTTETHCYVARRSSSGTILPDSRQPFAGKELKDTCKYSLGSNSRAYRAETFVSKAKPDTHHGGAVAERDINGHALLFDRDALGRIRAVAASWQDRDILGQDYWNNEGQLGEFSKYNSKQLCNRLELRKDDKDWSNVRGCKGLMLRTKWQDGESDKPYIAASVRRYVDPGLYSADGGGASAAYQDSVTISDRLGRNLSAISEAASCRANQASSHTGAVCGSEYHRSTTDGWKAYDALGRVHRSYYPTSWQSEIIPSLQKNLLQGIASSGSTRRCVAYQFDGQSRPLNISLPEQVDVCDGGTSTSKIQAQYTVAKSGSRKSHRSVIVDPEGYARAYDRDTRGRLTSVWEMQNESANSPANFDIAKAQQASYSYNPIGELLHVKPANTLNVRDNWISVLYDDLGRRSRISDPDRGNWSFSYDNLNQVLSRSFSNPAITAGENQKSIRYDYLANRIWQVSYPNEQGEGRRSWRTVTYGYDRLPNNLKDWLKWTGGLESGSDKILAQNLQGRLQELDCSNCLGQQTLIQDGSGLKLTTSNLLGQPELELRSTWFAREGEEELPPLTEIDRIQTRFTYDNWGMLKQKQFESLRPITPHQNCELGSGGYSAHCNLSGLISMRYDQGGRLGELRYDSDPVLRLAYNAFAQKHLEWRSDGAVSKFSYDENRRWLSSLETKFALGTGKAIQNVTYTHDRRGLIKSLLDESIGSHQFDFKYDPAMRLVSASSSIGGTPDNEQSYAYDANHRIINKVDGNLAAGAKPDYNYRSPSAAAGPKWQPLHAPKRIKSGNQTTRMDYDAWGNVTRTHRTKRNAFVSSQSLKWDHDNRLLRAEVEQAAEDAEIRELGGVEFIYDHSGSRTIKQVYRPLAKVTPVAVKSARVNRANKISERPRLRQGGEISVYPASYLTRRYGGDGFVHLSDGSGQRFVTLRLKGSGGANENLFYYSSLPNGSVTAVTRKTSSGPHSGKLVQRLNYWPYGELKGATDPGKQDDGVPVASNAPKNGDHSSVDQFISQSANSSRFEAPFYAYSGKEWDEVTGLSYFGARYYNSQTALWINPDPIIEGYLKFSHNGGVLNPQNISAYSYSYNSPISFNDTEGEKTTKAVAYLVKPVGSALVRLGKLTKSQAVQARLQGKNILSKSRRTARQIETTVGETMKRSSKTRTSNSRKQSRKKRAGNVMHHNRRTDHVKSSGNPHYQVEGLKGHNFYGVSGGLSDALDAIGSGLEAVGKALENFEANFPATVQLLDTFDPLANAQKMYDADQQSKYGPRLPPEI